MTREQNISEIEQIRQSASTLLKKHNNDYYTSFDDLTNNYSVVQILSAFNLNTLKAFHAGSDDICDMFLAMLKKDVDETFQFLLQDDEMFDKYFSLPYFYHEVSYDVFRNVILKFDKNIEKCPIGFFKNVSSDYQTRLLQENISDEVLVYMIPFFHDDVIEEFFLNDSRALYLFEYFDIVRLVERRIRFNEEIVKRKTFFDKLKTTNFIEFRSNINYLENYYDTTILEKRVHDYYQEIFDSYDDEHDVFKEYMDAINDSNFNFDNNRSFILDNEVISEIRKYISYDDNGNRIISDRKKLIQFLMEETSKKLSDVIVDALFEDNIYNVWINLQEMLRYNDKLPNDQKVLDDERKQFYLIIYYIDYLSSKEKLDFYNSMKDKKISFMFYRDLRELKDLSYDFIREDLFDTSDEHYNYTIDDKLSNQYGVKIYDMREQKYTMLVRVQNQYYESSMDRRNCYSLINEENNKVYLSVPKGKFAYGYNSFDNDMVMHMLEKDSWSGNPDDYMNISSTFVNRIMTSDELVRGNRDISEIDLANKKGKDGKYLAKKPDYLVYYENSRRSIEEVIHEAKRLGLPVVVLKEQVLSFDRVVRTDELSKYCYFGDDLDYAYAQYQEERYPRK